jgi:hypothetical protein
VFYRTANKNGDAIPSGDILGMDTAIAARVGFLVDCRTYRDNLGAAERNAIRCVTREECPSTNHFW